MKALAALLPLLSLVAALPAPKPWFKRFSSHTAPKAYHPEEITYDDSVREWSSWGSVPLVSILPGQDEGPCTADAAAFRCAGPTFQLVQYCHEGRWLNVHNCASYAAPGGTCLAPMAACTPETWDSILFSMGQEWDLLASAPGMWDVAWWSDGDHVRRGGFPGTASAIHKPVRETAAVPLYEALSAAGVEAGFISYGWGPMTTVLGSPTDTPAIAPSPTPDFTASPSPDAIYSPWETFAPDTPLPSETTPALEPPETPATAWGPSETSTPALEPPETPASSWGSWESWESWEPLPAPPSPSPTKESEPGGGLKYIFGPNWKPPTLHRESTWTAGETFDIPDGWSNPKAGGNFLQKTRVVAARASEDDVAPIIRRWSLTPPPRRQLDTENAPEAKVESVWDSGWTSGGAWEIVAAAEDIAAPKVTAAVAGGNAATTVRPVTAAVAGGHAATVGAPQAKTTAVAVARPHFTAPHRVIYADRWFDGSVLPPASTLGGFNRLILHVYLSGEGATDNISLWTGLSDEQRAATLADYHAHGIALILGLHGAMDAPTTNGVDAGAFAREAADFAKTWGFDGVDVDYEDWDAFAAGTAVPWIIAVTRALRAELGHDMLLSHAPMASFFNADAWGGGYASVHREVGHLIDWYNVQYYNQGPLEYSSCETLLWKSSDERPGTSLGEIRYNLGVEAGKLVLGKPIEMWEAAEGGYMAAPPLAKCMAHAREMGFEGIMFWQMHPDVDHVAFLNTVMGW